MTCVTSPGIFKVVYTDGDTEELDRDEVRQHELEYDQHYLR